MANARPFELALELINRAERLLPCTLQKEAHYQIGDRLLLRRGKQQEGSKFEKRMWLGPFKVISVEQPRYVLENAPGRNSRKPVYCRRLRPFRGGMSNISMVKRIARMVFSSRMNNRLIKKGSCTESELRGP